MSWRLFAQLMRGIIALVWVGFLLAVDDPFPMWLVIVFVALMATTIVPDMRRKKP